MLLPDGWLVNLWLNEIAIRSILAPTVFDSNLSSLKYGAIMIYVQPLNGWSNGYFPDFPDFEFKLISPWSTRSEFCWSWSGPDPDLQDSLDPVPARSEIFSESLFGPGQDRGFEFSIRLKEPFWCHVRRSESGLFYKINLALVRVRVAVSGNS